ncbi:MAG: SagB/ThcOx family dehydrogenase [Sulfolobales archaeon]|nr:SagB/ThcOx family dehydrogenase [Sulfolobales archaeon]MCX8199429.1 SagB/ThcOx family dehydrogenase [Sulfolobales archaeon]MDW8170256.1 SagB/ThcOx family dehydrogenase [Desulfurococcaceae archaeon]
MLAPRYIWIASLAATVILLLYVASLFLGFSRQIQEVGVRVEAEEVLLPLPKKVTLISVEEAMLYRRSIRDYLTTPVAIEKLSMILWAAQGVSETKWGLRTAPSAGATYPLEVYIVVGASGVALEEGVYLEAGVYKYDVHRHSIKLVAEGDRRAELAKAALGQEWVENAPVVIVICAVYERTTARYGERGYRYVYIEVGHAAQNIYLMATALGLGTVAVGAFYDDEVARVVGVEQRERPLYIMPIGVPQQPYVTSFEEIGSYYSARR